MGSLLKLLDCLTMAKHQMKTLLLHAAVFLVRYGTALAHAFFALQKLMIMIRSRFLRMLQHHLSEALMPVGDNLSPTHLV